MKTGEINFDGLVGPTHNYAGLSFGNVASMSHKAVRSNPREAAWQGLDKMWALASLGFEQGVIPPQARPDIRALRNIGFAGSDGEVLRRAKEQSPELLAAVSSASSMWTANAATVSPSVDSGDGRVHVTPANLFAKFHRSIETTTTARILTAIFKGPSFCHHSALAGGEAFADEGAANHSRFATAHEAPGLQMFVFGRAAYGESSRAQALRYPARQTLEASRAMARLHQLDHERVVFAAQDPRAINAGAFHNDVVAVGNLDLLLCHEQAFAEGPSVLAELRQKFRALSHGQELNTLVVPQAEVSLDDATSSYLFNSQLLRNSDGHNLIVLPFEARENKAVAAWLERNVGPGQILERALYFDLRQSMQNGGGPACLRLRVVLNEEERRAVNPGVRLDHRLYQRLREWIGRTYRDRLTFEDLADPALVVEVKAALDELTAILNLGPIYEFQTVKRD